jgi:hypothetical protein
MAQAVPIAEKDKNLLKLTRPGNVRQPGVADTRVVLSD